MGRAVRERAAKVDLVIEFRQSNHEGELVRPVATGVMFGFGAAGWLAAIEAMKQLLDPPFPPAKK